MSTNHDAVAALPISGAPNKTLLRNVLVQRMPYVLGDAENFANVIAIDPDTAATIVDVLYLGRAFHYDPTDTTTTADGTSCLVSSDGLRFKLSQGTDVFCYAVLDNTIATPPVSPSIGDAYLVAAAATGAWAGKSGQVAARTRRGWEFINFGIGRLVYVESVESYYHKTSAGAWVAGIGNQTIGANSVALSAAINFGKRLIVENQTTTAPPGSPSVGTAYIIGAGATGAWAGQDGKLAICEVASTFTIYQPSNGWAAYDKAQSNEFRHNGSSWVSAIGALLGHGYVFTTSGSTTFVAGSAFTASHATAPTTSNAYTQDNATLSWTARKSGAKLRFKYSWQGLGDWDGSQPTFALFRGSETTALAWYAVSDTSANANGNVEFLILSADATAQTYTIRLIQGTSSGPSGTIGRRLFQVEELA